MTVNKRRAYCRAVVNADHRTPGETMDALDTLTIQIRDAQNAREKAERAVSDMRLKIVAMERTVRQMRDNPCPVRSALANLIPPEPVPAAFVALDVTRPATKAEKPQRIVKGCGWCGGSGRVADERCMMCGGEG